MIYFDNAATSFPKHRAVKEAMLTALKTCGNAGRSGHIFALNAAEIVYNCRKKLAKMFNTRPECVIFTSSATESLNLAIKGTNRPNGVTLVSSMEHNAVMRPLNTLRKSSQTVLRQFLVDVNNDDITMENFSAVSNSATSVVLNHASNVCGKILPVSQLRRLASDETVFILDASQSAGHINIDIVDLEADIICLPAHKGLGSVSGVGVLIINPYSDIIIDPLIEGGTGTNSKSLEMPEYYPERLESGTLNVCGIAALSAALEDFTLPEREVELFKYLVTSLRDMVDITLYGAPDASSFNSFTPVLLFNKKGFDCEDMASILSDKGFALRAGLHCAPLAHQTLGTFDIGGVRLSLGRSNTKKEIDRFLNVLESIKQ